MKALTSLAVTGFLVLALTGAARPAVAPGQGHTGQAGCAWHVVASPSQGSAMLNAVAATSRKDAWAVGNYDTGSGFRTLIEHWNGETWKVAPSPDPAPGQGRTNTLGGVVAISRSNAWAFGFYEKAGTSFRTLIEHWNGSSWSVVPSPNSGSGENTLSAASAVSESDIWAVGYHHVPGARKTLIEHWNGSRWRIVASPQPGSARSESLLFGVAAISARRAWTVGTESPSFGQTLAIRWNGVRWSTVTTANPGDGDRFLQAVTASSATQALAVGSYLSGSRTRALAQLWTGSAWVMVPAASPGADYNSLQAVTARSSTYGWAVGARRATPGSAFRTLIERWNGKTFTQAPSPSPGRGDDWLFGAAAVPGNGGFWAVGAAGPRTLIERHC